MPVLKRCHPSTASRPGMPDVLFMCPGCKGQHGVWTDKAASNGARWGWNGSLETPTFTPSILITWREWTERGTQQYEKWKVAGHPVLPDGYEFETRPAVCHSFVTDGKIQFLSDCTHALAGQTVPLPEIE